MKNYDVIIIGAGPAGLACAVNALENGLKVLLVERDGFLGGQLVKQTHMFFGSKKQYAATRGIDIVDILKNQIAEYSDNLEVSLNTTALAIYEDKVITLLKDGKYFKALAKAIVVATGASEKVLAFPNNDLPGVYGAGAVQTLMNVYGVKPGNNVIMVGAGNIGLIVSYQLLQAGVNVVAVLDAAPTIGGYLVHAAKLRRLGVPIYTKTSVKEAIGKDYLEKIVTWELDSSWQGIPGTEKTYDVDVCCLSVGLSPSSEILSLAGCEMKYVPQLSGNVPIINKNHETTVENIYVAGDVSGVEEASSAMVEGYIVGLNVAYKLGQKIENYEEKLNDYHQQLAGLRSGEIGEKIVEGINQIIRGDE